MINSGEVSGVVEALEQPIQGDVTPTQSLTGEVQPSSGVGGVRDVLVNEESVVDANKVAHIDLTPYAEKEDVYDKDAVDTLLDGKADVDDIPTNLSDLQDDADHRTVTDAEKSEWSGKADTSDIPTALSQLENDDNYVQDADYVHTDNNFTDEDKAAIGGIPENITDLSDVEVSNIQNGQVLKWDSTQNKFVNANESGGGSGDVADVKVNGTSVVDPVTKEAEIDLTGYAETSDIPTELADLSDDSTHRLVTDTEKAGWDAKADTSDIPTVNNNTITIQKNGQNVDTFTLNQTTNKVIDISVPTKTSDLQNDSSFIDNTVNNLANYYLKSDTYTQTEVNNLISAAVNGRFEKVTVLPASGEPNVIYLVPKTTALTNNVYDEYIWQDNAWELLGSTEIDLSNYVTTTDLATALADYVTSSTFNTTIANYYTKTEVGNLLDEKVDKVSGKGLSTYDYDATAKGIVDNVTTNLASKVDKVNGKGLSTEDYTTTEKNKLAGISTGANKVESSTTNGNIKIDGTETQVYDGSGKVDKVNGKGLSTNDYDNTDKAKVDMIDNTTTSATGNPISIADLKSAQIALNPVITFEPIQAGSGTPSPSNVRAISGYDKIEVSSAQKNIFPEDKLANVKYDMNGDKVSASNAIGTNGFIAVKPSTAYYFSISASSRDSNCRVFWYDANYNVISYDTPNTGSKVYSSPATAKFATIYWEQSSSPAVYAKDFLFCEDSITDKTYTPYHKTTDLSKFLGQTVYGLDWDVRTGKLKVTWTKIVFDGTEEWIKNSPSDTSYLYYVRTGTSVLGHILNSQDAVTSDKAPGNLISNIMNNVGIALHNSSNNVIYVNLGNAIGTNTLEGFKAYLANNPLEVCYMLETPFTIQLTPHEIALSQGYNYISTNGTQIQLAYHNGEVATHADVEQLAETVNNAIADLTKCGYGGVIDISSYTSTNPYVCKDDGYIYFSSGSGSSGFVRVLARFSGSNANVAGISLVVSYTYQTASLYLRKGMSVYVADNSVSGSTVVFYPVS